MIRRISKNNDYMDIVSSCPSGVIEDIYEIKYFIAGQPDVEVTASFEKKGHFLEVIIPSQDLQTLSNGVLMRKSYYKVTDSSYPDGYYNLEFIEDLNVWLGEDEVDPYTPSGEYLTASDIKTINYQSIVGRGNINIEASVPDYYATKSWVSSQGYATKSWVSGQGYLTSVVLDGYATKSWVSAQGYLTSETIPSDIATQSWVESQGYLTNVVLDGYATKSWVSAQGYLTSETIPSDIATQSWVESQGYLTSVVLDGYATESWVISTLSSYVPSLSGYATESWVQEQGYLTSVPSGYATESWVSAQGYVSSYTLLNYAKKTDEAIVPLYSKSNGYFKCNKIMEGKTVEFRDYPMAPDNTFGQRMIWKLSDDTVMGFNPVGGTNTMIYTLNKSTLQMEPYKQAINPPTEVAIAYACPFWCDHTGRIYYGNKAQLNWDTGAFLWYPDTMGGTYLTYQSMKDNIINIADGIFMVDGTNGLAYVFNETTQLFDSTIPVTNAITANNWFRYTYYYQGRYIYGNSNQNKQYEFIVHLDVAEPYAEFVEVTEGLPPLSWTYKNPETGLSVRLSTEPQYIQPVVINDVTYYALFSDRVRKVFFYLNGEWVADETFDINSFTISWQGTAVDEFWFGFGYESGTDYNGKVLTWNFGGLVGFYGWDDTPLATESWVSDQGYLTSVPSGYATESWVSSNYVSTITLSSYTTFSDIDSYISSFWYRAAEEFYSDYVPRREIGSYLSGYATESWVSSQQFATQSWVESQGYLTSVPSGYATESWVSAQGFITSIPSEYATQSWVESQGYLSSAELDGYATESWVSSNYLPQSDVWTGTESQWNDLTSAQRSAYIIALIR